MYGVRNVCKIINDIIGDIGYIILYYVENFTKVRCLNLYLMLLYCPYLKKVVE